MVLLYERIICNQMVRYDYYLFGFYPLYFVYFSDETFSIYLFIFFWVPKCVFD